MATETLNGKWVAYIFYYVEQKEKKKRMYTKIMCFFFLFHEFLFDICGSHTVTYKYSVRTHTEFLFSAPFEVGHMTCFASEIRAFWSKSFQSCIGFSIFASSWLNGHGNSWGTASIRLVPVWLQWVTSLPDLH